MRARRAPVESRSASSTVAGWPVTSVTPTFTWKPSALKDGNENERRARAGRRRGRVGGDREPERASARRGRRRPAHRDDAGSGAQEERPVAVHPERVVHDVVERARRERRQGDGEGARNTLLDGAEAQEDDARDGGIGVEEAKVRRVEGAEPSHAVGRRRDEGRGARELRLGPRDGRLDEERPVHEPAAPARHGVRHGQAPPALEGTARERRQRLEGRGRETEDVAYGFARAAPVREDRRGGPVRTGERHDELRRVGVVELEGEEERRDVSDEGRHDDVAQASPSGVAVRDRGAPRSRRTPASRRRARRRGRDAAPCVPCGGRPRGRPSRAGARSRRPDRRAAAPGAREGARPPRRAPRPTSRRTSRSGRPPSAVVVHPTPGARTERALPVLLAHGTTSGPVSVSVQPAAPPHCTGPLDCE